MKAFHMKPFKICKVFYDTSNYYMFYSYFLGHLVKYLTNSKFSYIFMLEITLTDENFEQEILKSKELAMVDFWAEWCGPCKILGPIVEQVAHDFKGKPVKIGKLNVDESGETASRYSVMSIPTLLFFKNGEVVDQVIGVQSKDEIVARLKKLMV